MAFHIDPDLLGLVDNAALVIGGAGAGMGRAHCVQLARAGCNVVVADLDETAGRETVAEVEALGRKAVFVQTDATSADAVRAAVATALSTFGRLDVGVNHVGVAVGMGPFLDYQEADWDRTIELCLKTAYHGCQAEALAMIETGTPGRIINISSSSGQNAADANSAYGAAKAGVIHLTKTLGLELAKFDIRVNCILPGTMEVGGGGTPLSDYGSDSGNLRFSVSESANAAPMRRLGRPVEVAGLTVFFASQLSSYVTGYSLLADGGLSLTLNRPQRDGVPEVVKGLSQAPLLDPHL